MHGFVDAMNRDDAWTQERVGDTRWHCLRHARIWSWRTSLE